MKNTTLKIILVAVFALLAFSQTASASVACATNGTYTYDEARTAFNKGEIKVELVKLSLSSAKITFINNTDCKLPASAHSYKVFDNVTFNTQVEIFDSGLTVINPRSTHVFNLPLAGCLTQIDGFYGARNNATYNLRLFKGAIYDTNGDVYYSIPSARGNFCTNVVALTASCSVNPSSVAVNGTLNWTVTTNATGNVSYLWSGTDGLAGSTKDVSKAYSVAGTKTGTVTVTSGAQTVTKTCTGTVTAQTTNEFSVSCSADDSSIEEDEDVTFTANVSNGNGSYTYAWSGSNGLSGNTRSVTKDYSSTGTKTATVEVTSNGMTKSASCTTHVKDNDDDDDLEVSCYANPTSPRVGQQMKWYADVDGGDGDNDYDWSGSEDLDSSSRSPSMTYDSAGNKTAKVKVRDGNGNTATDTCNVNVIGNTVLAFSQPGNTVAGAVYLSEVPYTGLADNLAMIWFILGLALFSAYIAYTILAYQKNHSYLEKR